MAVGSTVGKDSNLNEKATVKIKRQQQQQHNNYHHHKK